MLTLAIGLAAGIGALVLLALSLIGTLDVLTTRFLHHPIPGVIKLSEAGLVLVLFLGLAVATGKRSHVRIDLLTSRLGPRARLFFQATGYFFTSVFFAMWTWQMGHMAAKSWAIREIATGLFPYPIYPIKFTLFIGLLIATFVSTGHLAFAVREIYHSNSYSIKG